MAETKKAPKREPQPKKITVNRNGCDYLIDKKHLQNFLDAGWKLKK